MFRNLSIQCRNLGLLYPLQSQHCHTGVQSTGEILKGTWYPPHQYHSNSHEEGLHTSSTLPLDDVPPKNAKVVVCGGGMVGTSVLYHLAMLGWGADTVMLEQGRIGGTSSWRGSGFLGGVKLIKPEMNVLQSSKRLAQELAEAGHDTGWKQSGGLHLARARDRMTHFRKMKAIAEARGTECYMLTPKEVSEKCEILNTSDIVGALWVPEDGVCDSYKLTYTLLKLALEKGSHVVEECQLSRVVVHDHHRVVAVETSKGMIECDYIVNTGGLWARKIGQMSEPHVKVPVHPAEHYFLYTQPLDEINPMMPAVRDPDANIYMREFNGGFLCGGFEKWAKPSFEREDLPGQLQERDQLEDWDHFHVLLKEMLHRAPIMKNSVLGRLSNTSCAFSMDHRWIIGMVPELTNYLVAAGLRSGGSSAAGGIGSIIAELIVHGVPPLDAYDLDTLRFLPAHNNIKFLADRVREVPGIHYSIAYPFADFTTGRCLRMSPIFPKLKAAGAVFGQVMGYERPSYFQPKEIVDAEDYSGDSDNSAPFHMAVTKTWTKPLWFHYAADEYAACRERVAILDYSSFAKYDVWSKGSEVVQAMQYLCSNDVDIPVGGIIHTGMQNSCGGYENDCSLARIAPNHYMMIAPTIQQTRCGTWLKRNLPADGSVVMSDVTSMYTAICIMGPLARQVLSELTDVDLSTKAFPFFSFKEIDVGLTNGIRAMNITHTGELGWVLYIPNEYALHVYSNLVSVGKKYDMLHAGYYAMRSLRIEKFYAFLGQDLDSTTTPLECGRGFRVKLSKKIDFIGREALERQKKEGVRRLYVQLQLQDHNPEVDPWAWGGEPIYRNDVFVGITTTTGYGYTLNNLICLGFVRKYDENGEMAYVTPDYVMDGDYEVDVAGVRYSASVTLRSPSLPCKFPEPQDNRYLATQT
ncbi:pyruvate dehydrogenase phosphatase regulatory subunit, mitochondrial-like [Homarus americanus]|uniref:pyruvate dehydrogenase phosphatase regulatory subunit, mitochondrial-like n=1 Tax=Homarus americanus TaxID=6706 RepID=UPI001C474F59|nr:pyruvate dehydrogenase phosphatase regulatory subunit, mitochondrial-like [Homarus americanus]